MVNLLKMVFPGLLLLLDIFLVLCWLERSDTCDCSGMDVNH